LLKPLFNRISGILSISKYHLAGLNCRYSHSCPALFYLRRELEDHVPGCQVEISQLTINDPYYPTLLHLARGCDALFFSVYVWNHGYVERLLHDLAQLAPDRPLILGGPQAVHLKNLPPGCTIVEGEVEGLDDSFYQDLQDGTLHSLYCAEPASFFATPYQAADFDQQLKNRYIYYESSRGCPFACSYCLSATSRGARHRDATEVATELAQILEHTPRIVKFVDRTFNDLPDRALAIWRFLARQETGTRFHFEIAPDRFTDEMLDFLETVPSGLFQFEIGIQSTNPQTLKAINRRMDVERALDNIGRLARLDTIHLHVDLILGLPHEDVESFRDSFNRVFAAGPHYIQMGLLKVLPGTPISGQAREFGLLHCAAPPYEILATRWLSHPEIRELHLLGECVESFYNTRFFSSLWRYLRTTGEEPFGFFMTLLRCCCAEDFFNLAPTHKLTAAILARMVQERPDGELLQEILCFDWLRCGYRFLPDFLHPDPSVLHRSRDTLRSCLPQNIPGVFTYQNREEFLKQGVFFPLSGTALRALGLNTEDCARYICFLPEQDSGVLQHNKIRLLTPV